MTSGEVTLTREQLYEMVWKEPIRTVAARYHLSDRGLAKACMRLHVPVPGRGFWQKKAAGKELRRPHLPTLQETATAQERQITVNEEVRPTAETATSTAASRQAALERAPDRLIRVSSTLVDPHPFVERT